MMKIVNLCKRGLCVIVVSLFTMLLVGCSNEAVEMEYAPARMNKPEIKVEETKAELKNLKDKTKIEYKEYVIPKKKELGENEGVASLSEIVKELNEQLKVSLDDYIINQTVEYNYRDIGKTAVKGYYNTIVKTEKRENGKYYRVIEKEKNGMYEKEILDLEDKQDGVWWGEFKTREKEKEIEYEKRVTKDEALIALMKSPKNLELGKLIALTEYTNPQNYKGRAVLTVRGIKKLADVSEGFDTIDEGEITAKTITGVKGNERVGEKKITPSLMATDYEIVCENGIISFEINMTDLLKEYYRYYPKNDVNTASYKIRVEKIEKEVDEDIENIEEKK